ncbi:MAG: oligoendopeptidase F [Bacilli bacterium]
MSEGKKKIPKRSELNVEDTWKLDDIYATDEAWHAHYTEIEGRLEELLNGEGKLASDNGKTLLNVFDKHGELYEQIGKLYTYAHMRYDQDTRNSTYQAMDSKARLLYTQAGANSAWVTPEFLQLSDEQIASFLEQTEGLKLYQKSIDDLIRERKHVLSKSEEALLAKAQQIFSTPSQTFGMLNNADIKFPTIVGEDGEEVQITHGRYITLLESKDRSVRKQTFDAVYETYEGLKNTLSSTLSSVVKVNNFQATVRHFESARQAALSANNIPETVYDGLIATVRKNLHLMHRYAAIRKRALALDELHLYDMYTPIVKEVDMPVKYAEAQEILLKALAPLGEDYVAILQEAYDNRWVDVYENEGKRSGAYSSGSYATNPYILMNWQDDVNNLFTLAHEFGHSVHSYLTHKTQPFVYGNYSIFVAEVASTTNEALLNDYLLKKTTDRNERLYLINHFLEGFRGTLFRQTMFAEYEKTIHDLEQQGETLTADRLSEVYYKLNKDYFGPDVVIDEGIQYEWSRIPHFYYNFYVYQYATGYSAAMALAKRILEEGDAAVNEYKSFLSAGSSLSPLDVLRQAGVDMETPEPIEAAMHVFEQYLDELESLLFEEA